MQSRSVEALCAVARCGGSMVIYADTRPIEDLVQIASQLQHGATLTLSGMAMRSPEDLCKIAESSPGRVTFNG